MNSDLTTTLKATGFISFEHLQRYFGLVGSSVALESWMLMTSQGLWDRRQYRKGVHIQHWMLRTQVYLYLAPQLDNWQLEAQSGQGIRPDALLHVHSVSEPIALEVDTGKETGRQWQEKLVAYGLTPSNWHVLVVAQGKDLRLRRLTHWLSSASPRPWLLVPAHDLAHEWTWNWRTPLDGEPGLPVVTQSFRTVQYCLNGEVVSHEWAEAEIQAGHLGLGARERRHTVDVYHLQ